MTKSCSVHVLGAGSGVGQMQDCNCPATVRHLEAVEMAKKAELAEIRWTADAEVNKWMSAVETTVELTRDKIQEKVDKVEMGKEKVEKVEAEQQQMNFELENGAQVA